MEKNAWRPLCTLIGNVIVDDEALPGDACRPGSDEIQGARSERRDDTGEQPRHAVAVLQCERDQRNDKKGSEANVGEAGEDESGAAPAETAALRQHERAGQKR